MQHATLYSIYLLDMLEWVLRGVAAPPSELREVLERCSCCPALRPAPAPDPGRAAVSEIRRPRSSRAAVADMGRRCGILEKPLVLGPRPGVGVAEGVVTTSTWPRSTSRLFSRRRQSASVAWKYRYHCTDTI